VHLAEHQSNRPSVRCKRRSAAIIVSRHTRGNVIGLTDIEAIVRTPNDVDEPHERRCHRPNADSIRS
jgi:hypothetical protein